MSPDPATPYGQFEGEVVAKWDADGRNMTLTENFAYLDPAKKHWYAPKGSVVNGASIPQAFWSVMGGPFEGQYRNASVIHDVACDTRVDSWEQVHEMFYKACRCGGVSDGKAKLMYWAVYHFGPRWEKPKNVVEKTQVSLFRQKNGGTTERSITYRETDSRPGRTVPAPPTEAEVKAAVAYFDMNNPSIEDIRQLKVLVK